MAEVYGEEFLKLQGLDDEKLSLTDFIEGFIDSDNVANASVDANANIAQKDIVTLLSEIYVLANTSEEYKDYFSYFDD